MKRLLLQVPILALSGAVAVLWAAPAPAQQHTTVLQAENVRFDYAQVLRVTPVYQTLRATTVEQQCDPEAGDKSDSRFQRVLGTVREALGRERDPKPSTGENCRPVPVEREFRRPIAYDVDYVYKGARFRSRLPEDPGNKLKVRVAVTPVVAPISTSR
ncbi:MULTISPECIES: hypothetical protein [Lysobacter]|uniref:Uncharacterized protein n=2 Tax=Lysobacter TaxID=68 RepID=A0A0S2DFA8_LYSEN|nr:MULTISPECIES: hypothetical protein [Lysobacter]ALN57186.1 hypothetical protein GLE_1834 [Lysobacter enzymogenes]QCW25845.1 hypothetical protein FE772_09405 [Lysobacter enzymogenes]QQP99611.1 hypothetical protein JHW41_15960 [Lysobacter enzymogenes]ROU05620.1 hypothetical protein D9T17_18185 [Lysobacter enzymogenes]UZW59049.1 hypothetical protein BV903_017255 [Lysobacter enzymogenes]